MAWHSGKPADSDFLSASVQHIRENFAELEPLQPHVAELVDLTTLHPHIAALLDSRIVEMGSNSNGTYVRWENGLQIATSWCFCRGNGVDDWASASFTWAAAFTQLAALVAIPTGVRDDRDPTGPFDVAAWATYNNVTYGGGNTLVFAQRGSPIPSGRRVVAVIIGIGRWK